jgi:hypothetical protein
MSQRAVPWSEDRGSARRALFIAAASASTIVLAGALAIPAVAKHQLKHRSLFYEQFARIEAPALAIIALFAIVVVVLAVASQEPAAAETAAAARPQRIPASALWLVMLFSGAIIAAGYVFVFHRYFLADDEYSAWFQAVIFAHGRLRAVVPPEWCRWISAITPTSIAIPTACTWKLGFLPIHSLVRSLFIAAHAEFLAGPVTAALTIALVASTARTLWPDRADRMWISVAALATSTQFLFMSMTMFSMPTHLLFSALWLWLYVQNEVWATALLPVIGFVALGVHSPIPHGLWVAPFLLRFVWQRRWGWVLYLSAGYAVALMFWAGRLGIGIQGGPGASIISGTLASASATTQAARGIFSLPQAVDQVTTAMHVALIATWNSPVVILAVILAALSWRSLDTVSRDLLLSVMVMIVARAFEATPQGEGWGYRFIYDGMSNLALLTACGVDVLVQAVGRRRAIVFVVASFVSSVVIQLPMRAVQVEKLVGPYARTYQWMTELPSDIVVFAPQEVMWGRQMLRNDPFFRRRPVLVSQPELGSNGLADLERAFPGQVRVVTKSELRQFGAEPAPLRFGNLIVAP